MLKKILFILAGILVIVSIILIIFFRKSATNPQTSQTPTPPVPIPSLPTTPELAAQGKAAVPSSSGDVVINDPYKNPVKVIAGNALEIQTADFEIVYLGKQKSFVISLTGGNLQDARNKAEQSFLDTLGIGKDDACKLVVSMGVAPGADPNAAGKNYGLSFCPDGKPLPGK